MGDAATLLAFFITSLAIELTPGPNMAYLAPVGVSRGRRNGFIAVLGGALAPHFARAAQDGISIRQASAPVAFGRH